MERIGDFAKRCKTTIKTLRYYDQLGLLMPDYIDTSTNYRYYGPEKVEEMRKITELKDIGFTLDEIKRWCNATPDEKNRIAEEKHWALVKLAEDTAAQLEKLEGVMQNLVEKATASNINAIFKNDERVIGRWEFVGEYDDATILDELYFLPGGKRYWSFSWTKGYVKISSSPGDWLLVPYKLDEVDGQTLMFVDYPSPGGGWVLRQADTHAYTTYEIGHWDDIGLPFIDDPAVHGLWTSVDFVSEINEFNPKSPKAPYLWMKTLEFFADGQVQKQEGDENPSRPELKKQLTTSRWTKGKLLEAFHEGTECTIAPGYIIREINGVDYMFFEWKSGDVVWGKLKPQYYVLKRGGFM